MQLHCFQVVKAQQLFSPFSPFVFPRHAYCLPLALRQKKMLIHFIFLYRPLSFPFSKVRGVLLRKRELFLLLSRNNDASKKEECTPSFHFISLYIDLFLDLIFPHQHHGLQRFNHLFKLISGRFNSSQTSNCREMTEPFVATFIPTKFQAVCCSL